MSDDLKHEAITIALTLSPEDAKALIDGKRLMLRSASKPTLELRLGTPLGDAVAACLVHSVAPRGYKISSLNVGNRGASWQAHLDVDHPLADNSEHGAIAACRKHRAAVQAEVFRSLITWLEKQCEPALSITQIDVYRRVIGWLDERVKAVEP